jgi:hypothetical protein
MKKTMHFLSAIILIAVFSVGFRYQSSGLIDPVNMYLYDTLLLVADASQGILVYSVKSRSIPLYKMTIPLDGVTGMAMKDSIVYANSYESILALRIKGDNTFDTASVIRNRTYYPPMEDRVVDGSPFSCMPFGGNKVVAAGSADGAGGSYATFAIIDTFLYYVDNGSLVTMSIASPAKPKQIARADLGWSVETLFPTDKYLFIGGSRGMYIMDRSGPGGPVLIGSMQHFKACDPVVVQDTMAYVTLRSGSSCGDARDVLLTVSIAEPSSPELVKETPLQTPYGLAVKDSLLVVASGNAGYSLFSIKDPANAALLGQWRDFDAKDFIWTGTTLFVMGFTGIRILEVSDPRNPVVVAEIE